MNDFQRSRTPVELPELGVVYVRDVSMGLGMRLAQAIDAIPADQFSPFHETLQPLYREIVIDCVLDANGRQVFTGDDLGRLDGLGFRSFMELVKVARESMSGDTEEDEEAAKKN